MSSSFTISLWMTRPDCRVRGREEIIFSHTQNEQGRIVPNEDDPPNSDIALVYGCTENGEHSTIPVPEDGSTVHLIRVFMTDVQNSKFIFDFPLSDAQSGGYVSSEWVFVAITVKETSITPYVDGKVVPLSHIGYPQDRAMTGRFVDLAQKAGTPRTSDPTDQGYSATLQEATTSCNSECSGFAYFGLEYTTLQLDGGLDRAPRNYFWARGYNVSKSVNRHYRIVSVTIVNVTHAHVPQVSPLHTLHTAVSTSTNSVHCGRMVTRCSL